MIERQIIVEGNNIAGDNIAGDKVENQQNNIVNLVPFDPRCPLVLAFEDFLNLVKEDPDVRRIIAEKRTDEHYKKNMQSSVNHLSLLLDGAIKTTRQDSTLWNACMNPKLSGMVQSCVREGTEFLWLDHPAKDLIPSAIEGIVKQAETHAAAPGPVLETEERSFGNQSRAAYKWHESACVRGLSTKISAHFKNMQDRVLSIMSSEIEEASPKVIEAPEAAPIFDNLSPLNVTLEEFLGCFEPGRLRRQYLHPSNEDEKAILTIGTTADLYGLTLNKLGARNLWPAGDDKVTFFVDNYWMTMPRADFGRSVVEGAIDQLTTTSQGNDRGAQIAQTLWSAYNDTMMIPGYGERMAGILLKCCDFFETHYLQKTRPLTES